MAKRVLMKGNEVIAEAAIRAGCRHYFGYPITPQTEVMHYMAREMVKHGGTFVQAESEVAAINMVYGAAATGERVLTSSSSPGISLKQEGISYIAGAELPAVVVNIMRGGPGLGGILPSQGDYFQATKGGGHGDYRNLVIAPASVQELYELVVEAFNLADKYRMTCMIVGDGTLGQMMEPVEMPERKERTDLPAKTWAATGWTPDCGRERAIINSLYIDPAVLEKHVNKLYAKYAVMEQTECRWQEEMTDDADFVIVAYGTTARIARSAMRKLRDEGIKAGLIRPITLWPFPSAPIAKAAEHAKAFLTVEMSMGQMVDDVKLAVDGKKPVHFFGRTGGIVPTVREIITQVEELAKGGK